jgi:succinyl-diaminopimelate desuccinylase
MSNKVIEQTKQLMQIQSTSDRPDELQRAVNFVADIVAQHKNITIERFERNGKHSFLAYKKGVRPEKFDVLLNGHVDVVPGKPAMFKPVEKNGRLYGRGALDMKGTVLALTDVF